MQAIPAPFTMMIPSRALDRIDSTPRSRSPYYIYLSGLAESGRKSMTSRLRIVLRILEFDGDPEDFPWHGLRYQHLTAIRAYLMEQGAAPATTNVTLAALKGIANAAFNLGLLSGEDLQRIKSVKSVRGSRLPAGRALEPGELRSLFLACKEDPKPSGRRDAALLSFLYGCGCRRSELISITMEDTNLETGEVRITGKGSKQRLVYLSAGALRAVCHWVDVRGTEPGPLFHPVRKSGDILPGPISSHAVYNMLRKRAREAGVKEVAPHDLRRTFISDLLDHGADLCAVQRLAGHSDPGTTSRYDRRGERAKQQAAGLLLVPYDG